jgi:molybdate transport system regulatory protein
MARSLPEGIDALLALRAGGRLLIGRERIALLEAVMEHKSITKAAENAGFSYKTAWDAVNAINNLLPRPAFITRTGGSHGGGAEITCQFLRRPLSFSRLTEA